MNKYELLEIIGEGAYGIVIKARSKETSEYVAIKKFKEKDDQEDVRRCIYRELKMLKTLRASENIVSLKEAYRKRGSIYFVFEYVDRNMLQLLEDHPTGVSQDVCKNLIFQLCKALEWCHSHDIIHRDIKPENLLISYDGKLKLCDFGFARKVSNPNENGVYTEYVATRWYRPPELLLSAGYGKPVDIWAIGAILGELSDGQPLFPGDSDLDQLYVIQSILGPLPQSQLEVLYKNPKFMGYKFPKINDVLTLRRKYNGVVTETLLDFMEGCLELDPEKRFTITECLQHRAFRTIQDARVQQNRKASSRCKKANSFHEANNNRIIVNNNMNQNITDNMKLKLSLNDLTNISKTPVTTKSTINLSNINNNNNNRITTSSMSISTFSPRTTQNNSTIQFTELVDERYNRSDYLTQNNQNHHHNHQQQQQQHHNNDSSNDAHPLQKSLSINGLSYNNLASTSSFLLKSKENFNEAEFNKYSSKYNTNQVNYPSIANGNNLNSKSPRDKKYIYYGSSNNIDEIDPTYSTTSLLTSRQKVQFKDETNNNNSNNKHNNDHSRTPHLISTNNVNINNQNPKFYRSESKIDGMSITKLPAFKDTLKNSKRSKTSMETEQDESNPLSSREITENTNNNINHNYLTNHMNGSSKISRSITQLNTINMSKVNLNGNQFVSKNPSLQIVTSRNKNYSDSNSQPERVPSKLAQQYNQQMQNNNNNNSNNIINHFDRSLQQNNRKSCFNLLNGNSFGDIEQDLYKIVKTHLAKASQSYRNNNNNSNSNHNNNTSYSYHHLNRTTKQKNY